MTTNIMEPIFSILPLNFQPQQKEFIFEEDNLRFSSKFDSGNMLKAERQLNSSTYFVQIASDCHGTQQDYSYKTWFFFSVKNYNSESKKIRIRINNMQNQIKLFSDGYKFVYRIADLNYNIDEEYVENEEFSWRRFPGDIKSEKFLEFLEKENNLLYDTTISYNRDLLTHSKEKRRLELITITSNDSNTENINYFHNSNSFKFNNKSVNNQTSSSPFNKSKQNYQNNKNFFQHTSNNHNQTNQQKQSAAPANFTKLSTEPIINLFTPKSANIKSSSRSSINCNPCITNNCNNMNNLNSNSNNNNINNPNSNNYIIHSSHKSLKVPDKPIVFISARVHPGETPSSFLMNGLLRFLLNKKDPRAEILRRAFVFKIIPIINVDGVSRGFYRYDTNSLNMNRHYISPGMKMQPEIYAIKKVFLHFSQQGKIKYYFDLHAHASSRGLFLFGNSLDFLQQIENKMLPKLIELNSEELIFPNCNFSEKSMKSKDRGDKYSKEGTGRVHFNKICDIIHCYTVEASYYRGVRKNNLKEVKPIDFNLLLESKIFGDIYTNYYNSECAATLKGNNTNKGNFFMNSNSYKNTNNNDKLFFMSENQSESVDDKFKKLNSDKEMSFGNARKISESDGNCNYYNCENESSKANEEIRESQLLLKILAEYFKIEIEKAFFGDKEMLKKVLIKKPKKTELTVSNDQLVQNDDKEKEEYEKIKNINLNINLSFDTLEKSKENVSESNDSSMDSSLINIKSERKISNNLNITNSNTNPKINMSKRSIKKEANSLFDDIDENNNVNEDVYKNTIEKYTENEITCTRRKTKFNSISNFKNTMRLSINNNSMTANNLNNENSNNKENTVSEKMKKTEDNLRSSLKTSSSKRPSLRDKQNINKNLANLNHENTENEKLQILKAIKNFNNLDFEVYQTLNFFDERYFLEANSFKNPNNIDFSHCMKEEERFYTPIAYEKMGVSLIIAVLDYEKLNPFSRIGNSDYKSIENIRMSVANHLFNSEEKYRSSACCQNYLKNLNGVKKFESLNEKIIEKLSKIEKANAYSKRSNSVNIRKINNPNFSLFNINSSNFVINNFHGNYFDFIARESNFGSGGDVNINANETLNDAAKKIMYNLNLENSLMSNININNYNFNVCNFVNPDSELNLKNNHNSNTISGAQGNYLAKKTLDTYIEENILDMLNYQRPSFFNNFNSTAKNKSTSKNMRTEHSTFNTINYIGQKSSDNGSLLNLNQEERKKSTNSFNNFCNYINQANAKNKDMIKINTESSPGKNDIQNNNYNLNDLAFAHYQLYNLEANKNDFVLDIPKRLKYQMDLLRSKSNRAKTNKAAANDPEEQVELETEEYDENDGEMLNKYFNDKLILNNKNKKTNKNNIRMPSKHVIFSNAQISHGVNSTIHNNINGDFNSYNLPLNTKHLDNNQINEAKNNKDKISLLNMQNITQSTRNNNNFIRLNSQQNNTTRNSKSGTKKDIDEKVVISGQHAAKLRMLKGLDLKGEKKKSDAFLNVKCVGLKADFLFNRDNNAGNDNGKKVFVGGLNRDDKTGGVKYIKSNVVNKTNDCFRKSNTGNFPAINKNEKK